MQPALKHTFTDHWLDPIIKLCYVISKQLVPVHSMTWVGETSQDCVKDLLALCKIDDPQKWWHVIEVGSERWCIVVPIKTRMPRLKQREQIEKVVILIQLCHSLWRMWVSVSNEDLISHRYSHADTINQL